MAGSSSAQTLSASVNGIGYMLSLSLLSRLASFSLNLLLAQKTSFEILGHVLDLDLLSATLLFLCREPIRMALLRSPPRTSGLKKFMRASDKDWEVEENALARNFAFVPFLLGLALTRLYSLYNSVAQSSSSSSHLSWESTAAQLYMTAALIELAVEPLAVYAQRQLLFKIRASVEGMSITSQCILTLLYFPGPMENGARDVGQAVLAYAWAQMGAALILGAGYALSLSLHIYYQEGVGVWEFWKSMVPCRSLLTGQLLDSYYVSVALSFWAQSFLKHLLTVGDRFLLVALSIPHEQKGIYRLVSELGSLIARILFQPLEETGRAYFSHSLTGREVTKNNLKISQQVLTLLVRLHLLLGAFFVFFGTHFTGLLLRLLYSSDKATPEASFVLRVYCIYVPVMGVNGILEAFFQGVGDAAAIRRQSRFLIIFWAIFVGTFYGCYKGFRFGISGLVIANIVNLWLRIEFAIRYARTYFGQDHKFSVAALSWNALFPQSILQWTGLLGSWGVLWVTQSLLSPWAHLGLGMGLGLVMLGIV